MNVIFYYWKYLQELTLTFISTGIIYACFHLFTISSTLLVLYFVL